MEINKEVYEKVPALRFDKFGIHSETGFLKVKNKRISLENCPVPGCKATFGIWENFARNLPDYYEDHVVIRKLETLPPFPIEALFRENSLDFFISMQLYYKRAFQILTFITSAIIHPHGKPFEESGTFIPDKIAKPLLRLANYYGRFPIMSYEEYCLDNCFAQNMVPVIGDFDKLGVGNFMLCQNFVHSPNEMGFIVPHQGMEYRASPIFTTAGVGQLAALRKDNIGLKFFLWKWSGAIRDMASQQALMWQTCDPEKYVTEVRPQIQRFRNVRYGTNGPFYPLLRGETGAHSPIQVLDVLLGVAHKENQMTEYLKDMRAYMPREQRSFLEAVERGPSPRDYILECQNSDPELVDAFNDCLTGWILISENHYRFMAYIGKATYHEVGTGGTPIYQFLPHLIKERKSCLIRKK